MDDGNNLVRQFWKVLSANFEKELRDATKGEVNYYYYLSHSFLCRMCKIYIYI